MRWLSAAGVRATPLAAARKVGDWAAARKHRRFSSEGTDSAVSGTGVAVGMTAMVVATVGRHNASTDAAVCYRGGPMKMTTTRLLAMALTTVLSAALVGCSDDSPAGATDALDAAAGPGDAGA